MWKTFRKEWAIKIITFLFLILTIWWIILFRSGVKETFHNYLFAGVYGCIALLGGVWGIIISNKWGGRKSTIGIALLMLSLGLFAEEFGQIVFSFYNIFLRVQVPYPSLADLGFFGNIPFYIATGVFLGKAAGVKPSLKKYYNKLLFVVIPFVGLSISYYFFLKDYKFELTNPLKIFLDFGYPLGQALYISVAIVVYSLSKNFLGGVMQNRIVLILIAFVAQYAADYNFLYTSNNGIWVNGGYGDYMYLVAYFIMTLGVLQFGTVLNKIKK